MRFRPAPLRAAAALAGLFVAVRVLYRVLFHGADGDGVVLLPLPTWRLPPPLAHVELLGPVTADGLWDAALSAVPIALVILAFGLLNALLDMPRIIARGSRRGPLQGLARAVSIAWATLPSLADAVRSARFAQRLRGERGGVRLLAPVLEHTLERATAVAAALELRGYAGRGLDGDCAIPVALREVTLGFGEAGRRSGAGGPASVPVIHIDDLELRTGELAVVTGATGAGKTTLLRALSGLHAHVDGGWITGDARVVGHDRSAVPPRDLSRRVGVVLQHPRQAFATQHVSEELGLALELRGVARPIVDARVRAVAARVGVTALLGREFRGLSAGEATLVAIAAAIVEQPILLLVDEPLADLDVTARARIVELLAALAHDAGMCVVVAEHRADEFAGIADGWLRVDGGRIDGGLADSGRLDRGLAGDDGVDRGRVDDGRVDRGRVDRGRVDRGRGGERARWQLQAGSREDAPESAFRGLSRKSSLQLPREIAMAMHGITVRHGSRTAVHDASITLREGEIVAMRGPNGAGKSSLLVALATDNDARGVALVPDDSDALFVRDTVAAECRRADRHARRPPGTTAARFAELLGFEPAEPAVGARLRRHPRDLSVGERRCLAIAVQTAADPRVLLLDEPTRGLDPRARDLVASAVLRLADGGTAVLFATHDDAFATLADRTLAMDAGALRDASDSRVREETRTQEGDLASISPPERRSPPGGATLDTLARLDTPARTRATPDGQARGGSRSPARPTTRTIALIAANVAAAAAFLWPLIAIATPRQAQAAVPYIALSLAPLAIVLVLAALDESVRSAHTLALLAVLAAIGAAIRIASTGVGGVEALFVLLILAGRAFGPRFGLLLGAASIALSALMWGGVGPWLPFQMFACGWVGAGAGLLPRGVRGVPEVVMLAAYGVAASYVFGLIMNMWFWPFAVGADTSISYVPGGSLAENLGNFLVYSLLTSTLSWDTLRAITTVVGLALVGRALLRSLRRAKPVASPVAMSPTPATVDA